MHSDTAALDGLLRKGLQELQTQSATPIFNAVVDIQVPSRGYHFSTAVGEARTDLPMTVGQPFHWASIAKTLTALLLLDAAERFLPGSSGLDTKLADIGLFERAVIDRLHCGGGRARGNEITLNHLLTHTSGLRDGMVDDCQLLASEAGGLAPGSLIGRLLSGDAPGSSDNWRAWNPDVPDDPGAGTLNYFLATGLGAHPVAAPGKRFKYSDTGYVILALVVEHLTQRSLHEGLRQMVFQPLGLEDAYLAYRDDPPLTGTRIPEAEIYAGDNPLLSAGFNLSFDWGGGGIVSSAASMNRILRAVINAELLSSGSSQRMRSWTAPPGLEQPRLGVGCGLFRIGTAQGELWGHSGAWGAKMFYAPDGGIFFSGTINQARGAEDWHWWFIDQVRQFFL